MVLVALALRLAVVPFVYDEWLAPFYAAHYEQGNVARSLLAGHGFGSPFLSQQPSAVMPPVYPVVVAMVFAVFGIHTPAAIIALLSVNCVFSALACIPVFLIAKRSFGPRVALFAGWVWAFFPYGVYFAAEWPWSTHLLLLCLCWLFYLAQRMEQSGDWRLWAGFGLLAGFAGMTEPSVLAVVPFLLLLACWQLRRTGLRSLLPAAIASVALAIAISPWMIRNALVFHRFIPMRDSMGLEMYLSNNGESLHWRSGDHHPNHDANELAEYNRGEIAFMDHKAAQASAYVHAHRGWYAWMSFRRAVYLWTGYWSFDPRYLVQEPLDLPNIPVATCISLLGFLGLWFAFRSLMYYFVHPEAYRMRPLDPFLAILGCFAVQSLRTARKNLVIRRQQEAALLEKVA
jgi:4-amino-4-deoxy-L-arabinose transferase-like glycosyltransferase